MEPLITETIPEENVKKITAMSMAVIFLALIIVACSVVFVFGRRTPEPVIEGASTTLTETAAKHDGIESESSLINGTTTVTAGKAIVPSTSTFRSKVATQSVYKESELTIKGKTFDIEIADTDALRQLGLSNRAHLEKGKGLLFVFGSEGYYSFWMKDMNFSIDIIWINANRKIVYMAKSVSPRTYPENFTNTSLAKYVLELPEGTAVQENIKIGDEVIF